MTLRFDHRDRPVGLDWNVINPNPDPSVWKRATQEDKPKNPAKLPDETEAEIVRLHLNGVRIVDIAEAVSIAPGTVGKVLDRRGVTQDRGRGARQRTSDETIAEVIRLYTEERLGGQGIRDRTGLSHATIYKILRRNGIPTRRAA